MVAQVAGRDGGDVPLVPRRGLRPDRRGPAAATGPARCAGGGLLAPAAAGRLRTRRVAASPAGVPPGGVRRSGTALAHRRPHQRRTPGAGQPARTRPSVHRPHARTDPPPPDAVRRGRHRDKRRGPDPAGGRSAGPWRSGASGGRSLSRSTARAHATPTAPGRSPATLKGTACGTSVYPAFVLSTGLRRFDAFGRPLEDHVCMAAAKRETWTIEEIRRDFERYSQLVNAADLAPTHQDHLP